MQEQAVLQNKCPVHQPPPPSGFAWILKCVQKKPLLMCISLFSPSLPLFRLALLPPAAWCLGTLFFRTYLLDGLVQNVTFLKSSCLCVRVRVCVLPPAIALLVRAVSEAVLSENLCLGRA